MSIFKNIEKSLIKKHPFVCYRKPNNNVISSFFQHDSTLNLSKNLNDASGFVFAPFNDEKETVIIPIENSAYIEEIYVKESIEGFTVPNSKDLASEQAHIKLVEKGVLAIKENHFKKVVLSRKEIVELNNSIEIPLLFEQLLSSYPNAFVYIWYHPKVGLWLGATPETLVKIQENTFETMSLAGTLPYQENTPPNWTLKEVEEQQFVTDYIIDKLSPLCESLNSSETETIKAGTLLHLKTKITGKLTVSSSELIKTLHPTPAVCGLPKEASQQFILNHENYDRSFYTGFLGELNINNSTELFVNLRCMEIQNSKALIYVGGGITQNSIPEKEWEETTEKAMVIKRILKKIT